MVILHEPSHVLMSSGQLAESPPEGRHKGTGGTSNTVLGGIWLRMSPEPSCSSNFSSVFSRFSADFQLCSMIFYDFQPI